MEKGKSVRLGIVVSKFNEEITGMMLVKAKENAVRMGAEVAQVIEVPGAFEIPFAVCRLFKNDGIDAAVALGAVVKGETKHDEVIMIAVAKSLSELSLQHGKPVGLGISGPGVTWEQAKSRAPDYAKSAVEAAVHMARL